MGARVLVKDVVRVYTQTLPVEKVGPDTQSTVLRGEGKTFSRAVEEGLWADVGWTCGGEDNSNLTCGRVGLYFRAYFFWRETTALEPGETTYPPIARSPVCDIRMTATWTE